MSSFVHFDNPSAKIPDDDAFEDIHEQMIRKHKQDVKRLAECTAEVESILNKLMLSVGGTSSHLREMAKMETKRIAAAKAWNAADDLRVSSRIKKATGEHAERLRHLCKKVQSLDSKLEEVAKECQSLWKPEEVRGGGGGSGGGSGGGGGGGRERQRSLSPRRRKERDVDEYVGRLGDDDGECDVGDVYEVLRR